MKQSYNIPRGYKASPLGVIPEEWEVKFFSELFTFKNGINSEKESYGSGIKFVNTMDVLNNRLLTYDCLRGSLVVDENKINDFAVQYGDVLFNRTSETPNEIGCSTVYLDNIQAVFGGFIIRAQCKDNSIDNKFKIYCFESDSVRKQIISFGNGAIRYNIGQEDLSKTNIILPPLSEQQKIAEVLSFWDVAIEKQTQLIARLETRKRGLMQRLLTGKKRLKGFEGEVILKHLKPFLCELSEKNGTNKNYKVLSVTNSRGFITQEEQFERSVASEDVSNYKIVRKGQFAYNPSRVNVGSLDLLQNFEEGILSPMYVVFKTNENELNSKFLYYHLNTYWFTGHIPMFVQGSVRDSLSFDGLCSMKFFIPSIKEQTAISNILSAGDNEIAITKQKLTTLKDQKKGLVQQLLTGKKRVIV